MQIAGIDVSRETWEKLEIYRDLLIKWQKAVNLVSGKSLPEAWERHFEDSAQLAAHLPEEAKTLVDLGSGAGFPGMVLAILKPEMEAHLIESDEKKAQFLRTVSRETNTAVVVHNERIERLGNVIDPDIVTARALAPMEKLFAYCLPWAEKNPDLVMLFPKGEKVDEEVLAVRTNYNFDVQILPSQTSKAGRIVRVAALSCA